MPGPELIALTDWEVLDFDPGQGVAAGAHLDGGKGWMPITAPGDVYLALVAAGRLDHPWRGRNEAGAAWVRDREWWQRITFNAPSFDADETVELVMEGLDTFACLYLDGAEIGRTGNMFRRYVFDLSHRLKPGREHRLAIRFDPPALVAPDRPMPVWSAFNDRVSRSRRNQMRKAQFGWGWDWGPDLPTVGVWREARLEVRARRRLADVRFSTLSAAPDSARVRIEIEAPAADGLAVEIVLTDPDGAVAFRQTGEPDALASTEIDLPAPRLWWTADLGDQPLYDLTVRLVDGDRAIDEVRRRVGVRTVVLDRSPDPDEPGASFFRFVLNGVPIFAKGACWVPTSSFVGEVDEAAYVRLIDQAVHAHMNMIRVWGGGVYEPDLFYDLCDRRGLLVWQDFMFACAHYPDDEAFARSVAAEVEDQVRRLRHHPCLALWCGNNENEAMHRIDADLSGQSTALGGAALYHDLMPRLLGRLDPETPYWPGSPWGGPNPNSMKAGDVHDWTVWHGVPPIPDSVMTEPFSSSPEGVAYGRYAEDTGRFISEFGLQAAPAPRTLERWMDPADLAHDSEGFLARIKDEARKADAMMAPITGLPTSLQEFIEFSQWSQAEGLKFGIEHFRRRRPHCSGALLWQFNDCWPCVSWSLVDHDGLPKAAYYAVRRAFAPVLASFRRDGEAVELWISNDTEAPVRDTAVIALSGFSGDVAWRQEAPFEVVAGSSRPVWRGEAKDSIDQALTVRAASALFAPNRLLTAPVKDLALDRDPALTWSVEGRAITLGAARYAASVRVEADGPSVRFDDNSFDLAGGETRTIIADTPIEAASLTVSSWADRAVGRSGPEGTAA